MKSWVWRPLDHAGPPHETAFSFLVFQGSLEQIMVKKDMIQIDSQAQKW